MENKYIGALLCVAVVVILTGSLLMPVINDAVDDTKVYYNNTKGPFADVSEGEVLDISLSFTIGERGSGVMVINGETLAITAGGPRLVIMADNYIILQQAVEGFNIYGLGNGEIVSVGGLKSVELDINGNVSSITATNAEDVITEYTFNSDWLFYRSITGSYRVLDYVSTNTTVYINSIDQVYASNYIYTTSQFFSMNGSAVEVSNGAELLQTTAVYNIAEVMNDVYSFVVAPDRSSIDAVHFEVDYQGSPYVVYPYYYVVPAEVYGQSESDLAYVAVMFTIPVLVLVAALVAVIGASIRSRY